MDTNSSATGEYDLLEMCRKEMREQIESLKEDREDGSHHRVKLANAIGSLARACVSIASERRQQSKHAARMFDELSDDEEDELLIHHFSDISAERLDKFQDAIDATRKATGVL